MHEPLKGVISSNRFHYRQHDDQQGLPTEEHREKVRTGPISRTTANLCRSAEKFP